MNIIEKGKHFLNPESQIQITGNREVLVDGCRKILEYNDVFVKVQTCRMTVGVWGSELSVSDFGTGTMFIRGKIQSVELEKNG